MIIVSIALGLGNQMFQYAAAKGIAITLGQTLWLDISAYKNDSSRMFCLDQFPGIKERMITLSAEKKQKLTRIGSYLNRLNGINRECSVYYYRELPYRFNCYQDLTLLNADINYLWGYFQSEQYFAPVKEQISKSFEFPLSGEDIPFLQQIEQTESVAIHLRRGDYLSEISNNFYFHCGIDYYQKALDYIREKSGKRLTLFVFTDEPDWARKHFILPFETIYVEGNTAIPVADQALMSRCKHQVTANSTFSWWAAWLNKNPGKIICTPKYWFNHHPMVDLIPDGWVKIK